MARRGKLNYQKRKALTKEQQVKDWTRECAVRSRKIFPQGQMQVRKSSEEVKYKKQKEKKPLEENYENW